MSDSIRMTKINGRNHNITFGIGFIITCVVMLLFLLNKTHEKLESSRTALFHLENKYSSLVRQFESLYEYKERLESSFMNFKEKKSSAILTEADALKSELTLLKTSHKTEIQRLHDELDACRRREEMAVVHRSDDIAQLPSISPEDKVISKGGHQNTTHSSPSLLQPSVDPNQDAAGNIFV